MDSSKKIRCNSIEYRQGFIEVLPGIHDGCINIETWEINSEINIKNLDLESEAIPEDGVTANTELELSIQNAELLISLLQNAINQIHDEKHCNSSKC